MALVVPERFWAVTAGGAGLSVMRLLVFTHHDPGKRDRLELEGPVLYELLLKARD